MSDQNTTWSIDRGHILNRLDRIEEDLKEMKASNTIERNELAKEIQGLKRSHEEKNTELLFAVNEIRSNMKIEKLSKEIAEKDRELSEIVKNEKALLDRTRTDLTLQTWGKIVWVGLGAFIIWLTQRLISLVAGIS